ncbi:MAG: hypothetical protein GX347_00090 [Epulopiscium sp.]|nr:hypothetical protein [Candidatus Epulonipiscium sp.]
MDIYIKCNTKYIIEEKRQIRVQDIAEVIAPPQLVNKIQQLKLLEVPVSKQKTYVISIMDIIKKIKNDFPDVEITNIGSEDILIEYHPQKIKESKIWLYVKVAFIAFIVLTGSTVAIISFHEDVNMAKVFQDIYKIFMGKKVDHPYIIQIPYSIGLILGIVLFFNHLPFIRFSQEPTPIEVEMSLYAKDVENSMVEMLNNEKEGTK